MQTATFSLPTDDVTLLRPRRRKYHRGSVRGPGTRVVLAPRQTDLTRKRILARRLAGDLTRGEERALFAAMRFYNRQTGQCDASRAEIARYAGYGMTTIDTALRKAKRWGIFAWDRRVDWKDGELMQTSNQYRFPQPPGLAEPHAAPPVDTPLPEQGHTVSKKFNLPGSMTVVSPLVRALASLGAAIEAAGR